MSGTEWYRKRRRWWSPFDADFPSPFFHDIDEMMREMERRMEEIFGEMSEKMPKHLVKERKLPDGSVIKEAGPFVYGYSVTIGPDGKPQIREFGNVKPALKGRGSPIELAPHREPLVDIIDQGYEIRVVAELPGVTKEALRVHATEKTLSITAEQGDRTYSKELELPEEVDPKSAKSSYNNGILEVVLAKKKEKQKGYEIKIE